MKDPHQNIFFYYRSKQSAKSKIDFQIENNVTKAFINLLEFCHQDTRKRVLRSLGFPQVNRPSFSLQIRGDASIPDGLIEYGKKKILIESKVQARLYKNQLKRHLASSDGFDTTLLVLTNNPKNRGIVEKIGENAKFFTWKEVTEKIHNLKETIKKTATKEKDAFILTQYIEFMETMGLSHFVGFNRTDFDSFLDVNADKEKEIRGVVKTKFEVFIDELFEQTKNDLPFDKPAKVVGNLRKEGNHIWSAIYDKKLGLPYVQTMHYSLSLRANGFWVELWAEGKTPTKQILRKIKQNPVKFTDVCKRLEGRWLRLDSTKVITPRVKERKTIVELALGKCFTETDARYVIEKIEKQHLFDFSIKKVYARDFKNIDKKQFVSKVQDEMKQLAPVYAFFMAD